MLIFNVCFWPKSKCIIYNVFVYKTFHITQVTTQNFATCKRLLASCTVIMKINHGIDNREAILHLQQARIQKHFRRGASPLLPHPPSLSGERSDPRKFSIFGQNVKARGSRLAKRKFVVFGRKTVQNKHQ